MDVQEFLHAVESNPPGPVTLLCPFRAPRAREATFEPYLAERAIQRVADLYVDPSMRDLCYSVYFADEADPAEIVSVANTLPFLTERRVVVVRRAERYLKGKSAETMARYLENPCESTVLLLVTSQIDKRSKLYKACDKAGEIVPCPQLREADVMDWVRNGVRERDKTMRSDAVRALVDRTGVRLGDVSNAVQLVCDYVGDAPEITAADVEASCADVAEEQIWALTDAIAASDTTKTVRALRELLDLGMNEVQIMGSINWLLKSAHTVASGSGGYVNQFVARKVKPLADKIGPAKMPAAFALCINTEIMLRSTGVDRALALELLVIKLAVAGARRRRVSA